MRQAIWNGAVIAESDKTVKVEGNHYFPSSSVKQEYLAQNSKTSVCPWKGVANYYDIIVKGKVNPAAAWTYAQPSDAAKKIKDHVAFWGGVQVKKVGDGSGENLLAKIKGLFG